MADAEFEPPKYAQIVAAIRQGIADGTYPPGSLLPSETKLIEEFGVSRPTVVRALEQLKLAGEIDREHGRGSFVKAAPALPELTETLREVAANLDAYIERRAQEIAAPRIAAVEQQAREQIADLNKKAIAARQRASDLEAELRRQLDAQIRRAERAEARVNTS